MKNSHRPPRKLQNRPADKPFGRPRRGGKPGVASGPLRLYGTHAVRAALANPERQAHKLIGTEKALARIADSRSVAREIVEPAVLDRLVGRDAVHQGIVLECDPLDRIDGSELFQLADAKLVLALDQVTDPHNVGAILRSAVALDVDCVIVTSRDSATETGVLAKSASGALDMISIAEVRNLSRSLLELQGMGFACIGLDSEGSGDLAVTLRSSWTTKLAIVLGAEGRGLRENTRETCDVLARLDMPGRIKSLNVSNAAALALYLARAHLDAQSSKPR